MEKRKLTCVGIWFHELYDPNDLEKINQNYLNRKYREYNDFERLDEVNSMRRCLSASSNTEVIMSR